MNGFVEDGALVEKKVSIGDHAEQQIDLHHMHDH